MKGEHIGELEELVLLTVGALQSEAYAVTIHKEILENTERKLDVTAIHSVLRRLEKKGYVKSTMGGATSERGGRRKRFFTLTAAGTNILDQLMSFKMELYQKIPRLNFSLIK